MMYRKLEPILDWQDYSHKHRGQVLKSDILSEKRKKQLEKARSKSPTGLHPKDANTETRSDDLNVKADAETQERSEHV
jgi:hypothetical protein